MYRFIEENLELFIVEGDSISTYKNIKEFTSICLILEHSIQEEFELIFDETSAEFIAKTILENTLTDNLKSGTGVFFNNLKSVFFNAALSKKIGLTSAGLTISNLFSGYGISNLVLAKGLSMTPTLTVTGGATTGLVTVGIFSVGLFLTLMAGATIYRMIGTNATVLIKNFEDCVRELISDLKRFNSRLNDFNEVANKLYEKTVDEKCGKIEDKKELLICGSKNYMLLCTQYILPEIFRGYYLYLKSKNFEIDYINSASDLFYYKNNKDRTSHYAEKMYTKYHEIFDIVLKNEKEFKSNCIRELNSKCINIFKQESKNARF